MGNKKHTKLNNELDQVIRGEKALEECKNCESNSLLIVVRRLLGLNKIQARPSTTFKQELRRKLLTGEAVKNKTMKTFNMGDLISSQRFRLVTAIVLVLALISSSFYFLPIYFGKKGDDSRIARTIVGTAYAKDNFELKASKIDDIGIDITSYFTLTSKQDINKSEVEELLSVSPAIDFRVQEVSKNTFNIIPVEDLESNKVYSFDIVADYIDENDILQKNDFGWAYQTKNVFKITSVLPGDEGSGVPVNTGIEVRFSHEGFTDYKSNFSISPKVEGKFEVNKKTLIFIPKNPLAYSTVYTVTVGDGIGLKNTSTEIKKGITFSFETQQEPKARDAERYVGFNIFDTQVQFPSFDPPVIEMYSSKNLEITANVYRFDSLESYVSELKRRATIPRWQPAKYKGEQTDVSTLARVDTFTATIESDDWTSYLTFPGGYSPGYYMAEFNATGADYKQQLYIQVSDLSTYLNFSKKNSVMWVNDVKTKQPVANASVTMYQGQQVGVTKNDGTVIFTTPSQYEPDNKPDGDSSADYFIVRAEGKESIVSTAGNNSLYVTDDTWEKRSDKYRIFTYLDRDNYRNSDSIKLFGVVRSKANQTPFINATVGLYRNWWGYDLREDSVPLYEVQTKVNSRGIYEAELSFENLPSDWYSVVVISDGKVVDYKTIRVQDFKKPPFKIDLDSDVSYAVAGDVINYNVSASYFDSTPVSNIALNSNSSGVIQTNELGKASYQAKATSGYLARESVRPQEDYFSNVSASKYVNVLDSTIEVRAQQKPIQDDNVRVYDIKIGEIDFDALNKDGADVYNEDVRYKSFLKNYSGNIVITKTTWDKEETGTKYNYITKTTYKTYKYNKIEEVLRNDTFYTNSDGLYTLSVSGKKGASYRVEITSQDSKGRVSTSTLYPYFGYADYNFDDYIERYYRGKLFLKNLDGKDAYNIGDTVNVGLEYRTEEGLPDSSRYLFIRSRQGILDNFVTTSPKFTFDFDRDHIPNVFIEGVWFNGRIYVIGKEDADRRGFFGGDPNFYVKYDLKNSELDIDLSLDKEKFAPGDEITLNAEVTDNNGNPVESVVNINFIDDAYYALFGYDIPNPNGALNGLESKGQYSSASALEDVRALSGAEGGGCFTGKTLITMADGTTKLIKDVKIGDKILTRASEGDSTLVEATVEDVWKHLVEEYMVVNGYLEVTPVHILYINGEWQLAGRLKIGDTLVDENGNEIVVDTIERVDGFFEVYNLTVSEKHTFIADGVYVHNGKGEGEVKLRSDFRDRAYFASFETDSNGKGSTSFTLPDNVTAWRYTALAVTDDNYAGATNNSVAVTLPVFVNAVFNQEYVLGDEPTIKLIASGTGLQKDDKVKFIVEIPDLDYRSEVDGKAFVFSEIDLPRLPEGIHAITIKVLAGDNGDGIEKSIKVVKSRLSEPVSQLQTIEVGKSIDVPYDGVIDLRFSDKNIGKYYWSLWGLTCDCSNRLDDKAARLVAYNLLSEYFNFELPQTMPKDLKVYQRRGSDSRRGAGMALLPYSDPELALSAQIAGLLDEGYNQFDLMDYFESYLDDENSSLEELSYALYGEASLGEPVLNKVRILLGSPDLAPEPKAYLASAVAQLGAKQMASKIFNELFTQYGREYDKIAIMENGVDQDDQLSMSVAMLQLASLTGEPLVDKLFTYIQQNATDKILIDLQTVQYLKYALAHTPLGKSEIEFTVAGKDFEYQMEYGESRKLSLTSNQVRELEVKKLKGNIGVTIQYEQPIDITDVQGSDFIKITKQYSQNGKATNAVNDKDLVKVTITPQLDERAVDGSYEVVDIIPSGFKYVRISEPGIRSAYEESDQKVHFYVGSWRNENKAFSYYIRPVTRGTYVVEPATLRNYSNPDVVQYSHKNNYTITIK